VTGVRLSGDDAEVSTKSEVVMATATARPAYELTHVDSWTRTADGWRLKESFEISAHAVAAKADPETVKAVVAELKQRAAPLATVLAGAKMDDLAAFGKAVGDARIVALGEASHGTREFFQMKHRLLEYLVKEKGFTVFAIEANWPEALAADRYIKTGAGDAKAALSAMYFWTWNTEEVRDMIEWMRAFNQAPGKHATLTFTSFDMQTGGVAAQQALDYLKRYSAVDAPAAETAYAEVSALDHAGASDGRAPGASERAAAVLKVFDAKRTEMETASSPAAWRDARQAAAIAYQACQMRTPGKGSFYRDEMMAKNVEWLADEAYPGEKMVLWAHNGHVRFGSEIAGKSMGAWLRERFGRKMYVAGFAFRRGQLRAVGMTNGQMKGLAEQEVAPAPEGSGDAILSAAGMPLFFLDMSSLAADGPLGRWLGESHLYYDVGAVWQTSSAEANLTPEAPAKSYDGLIFVEEGHAARGLNAQR
jgi:erythromycin esterase